MSSHGSQLKELSGAIRKRRARAILPIILSGVLLLSGGCGGIQSTPAESENTNESLTASGESFITSINGEPFTKEKERYSGGYRVETEGTCPDTSSNVYIVVKPEGRDYFLIQSRVVRTGKANWIGQAFLGEPDSGIGENFLIFAICTHDTYKDGQRVEREPEGIRSPTIRYTRTQN
ncbi:MAG TPA: hypothetical protein VNH22_10995 [Blastocatellia bacterium]|jgi:hypothetical protein|nr:hypothetical protein [Blastocatellia bacterium]